MARAIAVGILLGGAVALPMPARAVSASVWTGAASDDWADTGNWVVPPTAGSFVLIDALSPHAAHLRGAASVGAMTVGGDGQGELVIESGGVLEVLGSQPAADPYGSPLGLVIGDARGSEGTVRVEGDGVLVAENNTLVGNGGTGNLSITGGGTAELGLDSAFSETVVGFGYYGWGDVSDGVGHVAVDGAGSSLTYAGGLNVLNGTVDVTNGGRLEGVVRASDGGTFWVDGIGFGLPAYGSFAGLDGEATVTVSGAGSAWNSVSALNLGWGGDGTLAVLDGGAASFTGFANLGVKATLFDEAGHSTGQTRAGTGTLLVSGEGSGFTLVPLGDGSSNGDLRIGYQGASSARIDAGASASIAGVLIVGDGAAGSLDIATGGTTTVGGSDSHGMGLTVGNVAGSSGAVTVAGAGSTLVVDAGAQIGNSGSGSLSVLDGGHASIGLVQAYSEIVAGLGYYGWGVDTDQGDGSIIVDGAGSLLEYGGGLNLLGGTVAITDGGRLASVYRESDGVAWLDLIGFGVPANPNPDAHFDGLRGVAEVVVSGAGSSWDSINSLTIGAGGDGVLQVMDGAHAGFIGVVHLGAESYLYDALGGSPVPDLAPQSGSGQVLVSGAGSTFAIAAAEDPSWGEGTLQMGFGGVGGLTVADGGLATIDGGISVGGQGTVTVGGADGAAAVAPGSIATPTIDLADPSASLVFRHSATSYDFAPAISGTGEVDVVAGFTKLTGDSSAFAGHTFVEGGATLSVNGSLGGDIAVDGRLQGTGTVGDVTVQDGGVLAPGNSPGTLHVDGDLVMQTGSLYDAEIDADTGAYDSVAVAGNVTIEPGTTLSVTNIGGTPLTPGTNIELIQTVGAGSVIDGQFDTVTGSSDFLDLGLAYEDGKIVVAVERSEAVTFASAAGEGFEDVGAALDALPDDNALTTLLFTQVTSVAQAQATIPDMAGTMHADLRRAMLEGSRYPRAAVGERLQDDDASGGVAWARAMGGSASADGAGALPGASVDHAGVMVGYDTAVGGSRLGVAIGTDKGSYEADGKEASADLYSRHVSLYGRSLLGGLRVGYGLAFGATDAKGHRAYDIGSVSQHLYSKHEARTTQGFVDLGYRLDGGNSFRYLEPFLNLARVQVKDDATTEEGGVAALEIASGDTNATFATVGLRWSADMGGADFAGAIGYRHAFGFDGASATQAFVAGGPSFTIDSLPVDNAVVVDLGARFRVSDHARVWFGYDGMLAGSAHDHGLKLQFNLDL